MLSPRQNCRSGVGDKINILNEKICFLGVKKFKLLREIKENYMSMIVLSSKVQSGRPLLLLAQDIKTPSYFTVHTTLRKH